MAFVPLYCVNDLIDSIASFLQSSTIQPEVFSASQNDLDLGLNLAIPSTQPQRTTIKTVELRASTAINFTGLLAPVPETNRAIFLKNVSPNAITLVNASGSSAAANRFNATTGGDVVLAENQWALLLYDVVDNSWVIAQKVAADCFKLMLPSNASLGYIVALNGAYWRLNNTGFYDNAGTKTANAIDVYYRHGTVIPTVVAGYNSNSDALKESIPLPPSTSAFCSEDLLQVNRNNPFIYFVSGNTTPLTIKFKRDLQVNNANNQ